MSLKPNRALIVFFIGEQATALPLESVEKIVPMADLAHPPGLPATLAGILNWGGTAVPVLRLDRLLQLPELSPGLYSMLVLLKDERLNGKVALLVDRVAEVVHISSDALLAVDERDSFNACAEGTFESRGQLVHLLSPEHILLEREYESLLAFQVIEQRRLDEWKAGLS